MKRNVEFITGLVGSGLGVVFSLLIVIYLVKQPADESWGVFLLSIAVLAIQSAALVLSCLVSRMNHIAYAVILIVIGIITLFVSVFILFIPATLQIISGAMAFRSLKKSQEFTQ